MIEKAIAASLEPLLDSLVETEKKQAALEARLADIQLKEGPAGRDGKDGSDADPEAVAALLVERHADLLRGADADPEAVAALLVEKHADLLRGKDGKDGASLKGVSQEGAEIIFELSDGQELSVELPTGEQGPAGEPGKDGAPGEQGPAGEPGKDADPVEVAKQAILLEEFNVVTTEAIKAMLAVRLQEEHDEVDAILN